MSLPPVRRVVQGLTFLTLVGTLWKTIELSSQVPASYYGPTFFYVCYVLMLGLALIAGRHVGLALLALAGTLLMGTIAMETWAFAVEYYPAYARGSRDGQAGMGLGLGYFLVGAAVVATALAMGTFFAVHAVWRRIASRRLVARATSSSEGARTQP